MITNELKDKLASINDLDRERYEDKVKEAVRKEMTPDEELAILRKSVALLFEIIAMLHSEEINNAEFKEYNNRIEAIKKEMRGA